MSSPLILLVLGQATNFVAVSNISSTFAFNPSTIAPEATSSPRRDDYTYSPGIGAHKVHTRPVSWNKAWLTCRNEGAQLAIINSYTESQLLIELLKKAGPSEGGNDPRHAHIGFHDLYVSGDWVTIDGQSLIKAGFAEWNHNEPNKLAANEHCGSMNENGKLNDNDCNIKTCRFISDGNPFLPSSQSPCLLRGPPAVKRDDYTYKPGIDAFKRHTRAMTWNEARMTCEKEVTWPSSIPSLRQTRSRRSSRIRRRSLDHLIQILPTLASTIVYDDIN